MHADTARAAVARQQISDRERRALFFPGQMFDDRIWDLMLHLFIALCSDEVLAEDRLFARARVSFAVGRRWLRYLALIGYIETRQDGEDVALSPVAVAQMRSYLDASERHAPEHEG